VPLKKRTHVLCQGDFAAMAAPAEPAETPDATKPPETPEAPAETPSETPEAPAETPSEAPEIPAETPSEAPDPDPSLAHPAARGRQGHARGLAARAHPKSPARLSKQCTSILEVPPRIS
jgi:hypothetical protein